MMFIWIISIGIPDCNGYRSLCWKLLLGYLTTERNDWTSILAKKRHLYQQFIGTNWTIVWKIVEIFENFPFFPEEMAIPPGANDAKVHDHPLSDGPESAWSTFFKDNEVLLQIDKDVRRLCPDISFFQQVRRRCRLWNALCVCVCVRQFSKSFCFIF